MRLQPTAQQLAMRDRSNRWFTGIVIGGGGVVGSVITVLLAGGILWGLFFLATGRLAVRAHRSVWIIAFAFAFYFMADAVSALANERTLRGLGAVAENIPFLAFVLIFSRLAFSSREHVRSAVEAGVIVGALLTFAIAVYQVFFAGYGRASNLAGNPGPLSLVAALLFGLCLLPAVKGKGPRRYFAIAAAAAAAATVLMTGMRTLFPMLLVAPFIPLVAGMVQMRGRTVAVYLGSVAVMLLVLVLSLNAIVEQRMANAVNEVWEVVESIQAVKENDVAGSPPQDARTVQYTNTSLGQRLLMWNVGLDLIKERPWLGYGPKSIPTLLAERTGDMNVQISFSHLHNSLLTAYVRSGIPGVVASIAILLVPLVASWRHRRRDDTARYGAAMMLVVVLTYACSGTFNIMLGHDILDTLFIYGVIVASYLVFGNPISTPPAQAAPALGAAR